MNNIGMEPKVRIKSKKTPRAITALGKKWLVSKNQTLIYLIHTDYLICVFLFIGYDDNKHNGPTLLANLLPREMVYTCSL